MRSLIFVWMILVVNFASALEPSLCEGDTLKVTRISGTSVIMCDCQCTNEESTFYIKPNDLKVIYKIEASRLVSQKTISQAQSKTFCNDKILSEKEDPNSLAFVTKVPSQGGGVCFEVSTNGLNKKGLFERNDSDNAEIFEFNYFIKQQISIKKAYLYDNSDTIIVDNLKSDFYKFLQTQVLQKFKPIKTKMYLIKGDKVTLLDEQTDNSGQKWYFINYKGKKDLNMWIKAEAVDLEPVKEKTKNPEPVSQTKPTETIAPLVVAKQKLDTKLSQKAESITVNEAEATKKSAGSFPLSLLAPIFGLLVWRMS